MAKNGRIKVARPYESKTCGECANGELSKVFRNRDVNGRPFLKICEHSKFAMNKDGQQVCLRSTKACPRFTPITSI